MSDGRAERLARQIRSACGRYNDDDEPVVLCVAQMRERISELEAKLAAAEADIQRLVSEAVEREALFQAERERVRVLREALEYAVKQVPEIGTVPGVKVALATTEPEDV